MINRFSTIIWMALVVVLIGCSPVGAADPLIPTQNDGVELELLITSVTPNLEDAPVTPAPTQKDVVELELPFATATPNPSEPPRDDLVISNPSLQNLVDQAKADLAERLSIPIDEIDLLEARRVTWPDGSLGCPQPGMQYIQVLTPGYLVLLKVNGIQFEYHAGDSSSSIFYCKNPRPPISGTPLDQ